MVVDVRKARFGVTVVADFITGLPCHRPSILYRAGRLDGRSREGEALPRRHGRVQRVVRFSARVTWRLRAVNLVAILPIAFGVDARYVSGAMSSRSAR
jgi:hypothetical protein